MLNPEAGSPPLSKNEIKSISVPRAHTTDGVTYYIITVEGFERWSCQKRYSQFEDFNNKLMSSGKRVPASVSLPPKRFKLFTSHTSAAFVEERRCLLEAYLRRLIKIPDLLKSKLFMDDFLMKDKIAVEDAKANPVELPEDVEVTGVSIPATRTMTDHILYQIDVTNNRKRESYSKWTVLKRFGQFYDMDSQLRIDLEGQPEVVASLPPPPERKVKLLNDHMDEAFVEQRRVLLENYLQKLLEVVPVLRNVTFLKFLGASYQ